MTSLLTTHILHTFPDLTLHTRHTSHLSPAPLFFLQLRVIPEAAGLERQAHPSHPSSHTLHTPHPTPLIPHTSHPSSHTPHTPHPTHHTPHIPHTSHPSSHTPHTPHPTHLTPLIPHTSHPSSHTPHTPHPIHLTPLIPHTTHPSSHTPHTPHPTHHTPLIPHPSYGTRLKNVLKIVRSVCVARRQRFPNGVKRSVPFRSTVRSITFRSTVRSVPLHGPFRFDGLPLPGFLVTDPDSINFTKNLAIPRSVALIPSCCNFRDISPGLRPWRWWYVYNHLLRVIAVRLRHHNTSEPRATRVSQQLA